MLIFSTFAYLAAHYYIFFYIKTNHHFKVNPQRQFIIVCGNINFDSVNGFLKDFFHPARDDTNTEVRDDPQWVPS